MSLPCDEFFLIDAVAAEDSNHRCAELSFTFIQVVVNVDGNVGVVIHPAVIDKAVWTALIRCRTVNMGYQFAKLFIEFWRAGPPEGKASPQLSD